MNDLDKSQKEIEFDFDGWVALCKKDPDGFEKKRQELIQSAIDDAPERMHRRLNGLQWRIDRERELAKNPLDGCIKVYQMMMDSVYEPEGLLDALNMTIEDIKESAPNVVKMRNVSRIRKIDD